MRIVIVAVLAIIALGPGMIPMADAQSNVNLPTIKIEPGTEDAFDYEGNEVPFKLTRSDGTAGELTVDLTVSEPGPDPTERNLELAPGYVASENLGDKTVTITFDSEGTAIYRVPTLHHTHHANGRIEVQIRADSTDPAEYSVGTPSSARMFILHTHQDQRPVILHEGEPSTFTLSPVEGAVLEGQDARFKIAMPQCASLFLKGLCGEVSIDLRVIQIGDYVDIEHYAHSDEDEDGHDEDEHEDEDEEGHEHEHEDALEAFQFQTVTIPDGVGEYIFSVPTVDDDVVEAEGRIVVVPLSVSNAPTTTTFRVDLPAASDRNSRVTVRSDDVPAVTVSKPVSSARTEGDGIVFQIDRTGPAAWPEVTVRVQPTDTGGILQSSETTTVTIPANQVSTTHSLRIDGAAAAGSVTLTVLDDTADPATHRVGIPNSATVIVLRFDEPDGPTITASNQKLRLDVPKSALPEGADASRSRIVIDDSPTIGDAGKTASIAVGSFTVDVSTAVDIVFVFRDEAGRSVSGDLAGPVTVCLPMPAESGTIRALFRWTGTQWVMLPSAPPPAGYDPGPGNTAVCGESDDFSLFAVGEAEFAGAASTTVLRIEPSIASATLSTGERVRLRFDVYGRQDILDNTLGSKDDITWSDGNAGGNFTMTAKHNTVLYDAPDTSGTYTITATANLDACLGGEDAMQRCVATFTIKVLRPSATSEPGPAPANPQGEIPAVLVDAEGRQYEVFTPEEGGKFDNGEGYSIAAEPGAVPNGEIVGVRISESGAASNAGMTQHRYTLGGNSYAIHVVDALGNEINTHLLDDPAEVCVPLPHELRSNISDLALVALNSDDTLTILAARVRLHHDGPSVCGNISRLPATVAVGSRGAPVMILSPTPPAEEKLPETGAAAPSSNTAALILILGMLAIIAILISAAIIGRIRAPRN